MTNNDINTLNGALQELGETMASNLQAKGVTASASDGLTTLAGKILTIPSGGSCYHIEFSEDSYVAVGGTATLEIMLQENYAPKVGATVTVTGSDSSLYTGITNNEGIATVTVSVSAETTFTATYGSVSDTCTVTVSSILYSDSCYTDNTSNYTLLGATLTFNTTNTCYELKNSTHNNISGVKINGLSVTDKVKVKMDYQVRSTGNNQPTIGIFSNTNGVIVRDIHTINKFQFDNSATFPSSNQTQLGNQLSQSVSTNTWYTMEFIVNSGTVTMNLYNSSGSLLNTFSASYTGIINTTGNYVAIGTGWDNGKIIYVKNIEVEAL